ncbi:phage tail sheath gpL-like [Agrobacterium vitis]|nr:phage tail sheath gpL-like [Agrobacterium vitis]
MVGSAKVSFNNIPGSGLVAPLFAFEVNSGGGYTSNSRMVLIGHKLSSAPAAFDVPMFIGSLDDADANFGGGSMLREMYRIARQNAPVQEIWCMPVAESGTAQVWTLTIGVGGVAGAAYIDIHGERIALTIATTDTATTIATALAAAINAYRNALTGAMLPFTATASTNTVVLTARHASALFAGEDPTYFPTRADGVSANIFTSTTVTIASTTAGTGIPTLAAALAALGDDQFDFIVQPWADAASLGAVTTALGDVSGRWAYLRQSYGHHFTCFTGGASALTTLGLSLNDRHTTIIPRLAGGSTGSAHPAWLWAAAVAARVAPWLGDYATGNASRNQSGLVVQGLAPPRDRGTWWGYSARNSLLQSGISTWTADVYGNVIVDKLVTTYQRGTSGQPDATFRDVQSMLQITHALRYMRAALADQQSNKGIVDVNPGNLGSLCTVKDIKATIVGACMDLTNMGILEKTDFSQINVVRDPTTPQRVNVMVPLSRVKPLDVLAANATFYNGAVPTAA